MKGQNSKKNNSMKTKSIILSIVSIIELIILLSTMTFAWFEGLTSLEIKGSNLSTASGLKSKFIVGEGTEYQTIAELNEFFHKQSFDKLSPVSSWDGDNFYAITTGEAPATQGEYITAVNNKSITFRKLSEEEKLSSIVHFQFEISSDSSVTDFWFKELPVVKINGNALDSENNPFRFSIDDGTGYAPNGENNYNFTTCVNWPGGSQNNMRAVKSIDEDGYATLNNVASESVSNRAIYSVFGSDQNEDGKYKLFTVPKGKTKIITIAIWIEAFDPAYSESIIPPGATVDIDIEFCSSWNVVDEVVFRDYTSDQWIDEVDEDQSNKAMKFGAVNLDSPSNYYYPFEYDSENKQWTADIPRAVQNIKFVWQGKDDTTEETAKWENLDTRENKTVFTAFGSTAGFWYDGKVDKITFSDYTGTHWVNNQIDSQSPKMKVQITYGGNNYSYSMSDAPTKDSSNKNVWHTYVPDTIETVIFNRYSRSDSTTPKHTWNGTDRIVDEATGTVKHTKYYALDGEVNEIDTSNIIPVYLKVANSCYDKFFTGNTSEKPSISLTCPLNISNINNLSNLTDLKQTDYANASGHHDDHWKHSSQYPHSTSDLKPGTMVPVGETGIYAFYFDKADLVAKANSEGIVYLTFWSENHSDFGIVDNNVRLAAAIPLKLILSDGSISKNTVLAITEMELITGFNPNMNNEVKDLPYICTNYAWYPDSVIVQDPNLTTQGTAVNGQWGAPDLPKGTYQTYFMHTSPVGITSVTAKFEYYGTEYTVNMTHSSSDPHKWYTTLTEIPDDVTSITFTDSAGNTWTSATSGTRTKSTPYYYATSSSAGKWSAQITAPSGNYKTYFVPPSGNTASTVKATFVYNSVYFTVNLTKGTDGNWSTQAIPDSASNIVFRDNLNHTWTTGSGRTSTNCYYMTTSNTAGAWGKPATATATKTIYLKPVDNVWDKDGAWFWVHAWGGEEEVDVKMTAVSGQSGLYSAEIPEDTTQVVFVRMNPSYTAISWDNGKWNQTVDLTIPSDSDTFTMTSSTNGTWYEVEEPEPASNVIYLKPNSNWNSANAWFAIYVWDGTGNEKWVKMEASSTSGVYQCEIPDGYSTNIIFCRMNPASTSLDWNNVWNQTNDLTIQTNGNNMYTVASGTWSKGGGTWSKFS